MFELGFERFSAITNVSNFKNPSSEKFKADKTFSNYAYLSNYFLIVF